MNGLLLVVVIELEYLRLMPALEERLGRQLGPEATVGIADIGDVVTLLDGAA